MSASIADSNSAKNVIVASHERSGTHFLINTLTLNFDFQPQLIHNDVNSGADFYSPRQLEMYIKSIRYAGGRRIIKDHHHLGFFDGLFDQLRDNFIIFYIYRNPADVICSFWRLVLNSERREGPLTRAADAFMRAPPCGGMLRYQWTQHATILDRWRSHVDEWTTRGVDEAGACLIRYEDLNRDFEATVARIASRLGAPCPKAIRRPSPTENVMLAGPGEVGGFRKFLNADDIAFIRETTEPTLRRLDLVRYMS
jgi:hypothetical protein